MLRTSSIGMELIVAPIDAEEEANGRAPLRKASVTGGPCTSIELHPA